jgi:hypothetical protein
MMQLLIINKIQKQIKGGHTYFKRNINEYTIADFQLNLSRGTWEIVFDENDVNKTFNIFQNIFLNIYYSSFPLIQARKNINQNSWITSGIMSLPWSLGNGIWLSHASTHSTGEN